MQTHNHVFGPLAPSKELVQKLKSCLVAYPRLATALLRKLQLVSQPVLQLVFAELPVKSGSSLASAGLAKLQGCQKVLQEAYLDALQAYPLHLSKHLLQRWLPSGAALASACLRRLPFESLPLAFAVFVPAVFCSAACGVGAPGARCAVFVSVGVPLPSAFLPNLPGPYCFIEGKHRDDNLTPNKLAPFICAANS